MASSGSVSQRRPRRPSAERRIEILAAARRVFIRSGFAAATIREVAAEADVNHAMMYRFFRSKEELFEEAVAAPLEEAMLHTLVPVAGEAGLAAATERFVVDLLVAMEDLGPLSNVVFGDAARAEHFYRHHLQPALLRIQANAERNLVMWDHATFDVGVIARMIYGICWFLALDQRYGDGPDGSPADVAKQVTHVLLNGMLARPPRSA
jgi:AcrR family transcriptional regulator